MDREGERIDRAHRHPARMKPVEAERVDKAFDVLALRRDRIIGVGRPVGVAMPALVERNAVKLVAQCEAAEIPGMRGQSPAMQENERPQLSVAPIEIVHLQPADPDVALAGQHDVARSRTRRGRRSWQGARGIPRRTNSRRGLLLHRPRTHQLRAHRRRALARKRGVTSCRDDDAGGLCAMRMIGPPTSIGRAASASTLWRGRCYRAGTPA